LSRSGGRLGPPQGDPRPLLGLVVTAGLPTFPAFQKPLTGRFTVAKVLLPKCELGIDCPITPLNLNGQTFLVNLASFRKP
jgi:hypothetical protein